MIDRSRRGRTRRAGRVVVDGCGRCRDGTDGEANIYIAQKKSTRPLATDNWGTNEKMYGNRRSGQGVPGPVQSGLASSDFSPRAVRIFHQRRQDFSEWITNAPCGHLPHEPRTTNSLTSTSYTGAGYMRQQSARCQSGAGNEH